MTTLTDGSQGPEVEALQNALVAQGYFVGSVDGKYGPKTAVAVGYFQSCNMLEIDGVAGAHTLQLLGVGQTAGAVEMTLPAADARISNFQYEVQVHSSAATHVRVVVWFTAGSQQVHGEAAVDVGAGATATATIEVPQEIRQHEMEVHVTAYAFDEHGTQLDEKASSFWVDIV